MAEDRLKALLAIAEAQPEEVMIWYGLANEYAKLERWPEAVDALRRTLALNADYTSAYQMLGTALMNLDQREEARVAWTQGIEAAGRAGAWKARQHMERLLTDTAGEGSGLCAE
jgi:Flp pilus assembly protein TadD